MPLEPAITGDYKGMAVIQVFYNKTLNYCTSISKWIEIDNELMDSMMLSSKITKYIEIENNGNVIKLFDDNRENVVKTYTFNNKHGIYLYNKFSGPVECLNLVDYFDESEKIEQPTDINQLVNFFEKPGEKNDRKKLSKSSFSSIISSNYDDETIDGIFIFTDIIY